jgi:hypothetical protein
MKKVFFLIAMGLLAAGSVSAQYYTPRRGGYNTNNNNNYNSNSDFYQPRVGLDVGVNVSNTTSAYSSGFSTGTLAGLHAGLTFDIPLIYPLSFAPEAIYSQKGYTAVTSSGNFTQRTQFIDLC